MAVTLTTEQLAVELRVITAESDTIPPGQLAVLTRSRAAAVAAVDAYAPSAPVDLANEAAIRLASWLFDRAGAENRGGNPFVQSGAAQLLSRHRSRSVRAPSAAASTSSSSSSSSGVDEAAVNALITAALASYSPVDATARAAAAAAQGTASEAQQEARAAVPKAGGTMTGPLVLPGAPTQDQHAATKGYVDAAPSAGGGADQTARAAIHRLQDVTADLHLDGRANYVQVDDATKIAFAVAGVPNNTAVAAGDAALDVSGITFAGELDSVSSASIDQNGDSIEGIVRLASDLDRSEWELRIRNLRYPGGHWSPIQVTNGGAYNYYFTGFGAGDFRAWRSQHTTTYEGGLGEGADAIRASLADLVNRTRDLTLDGATRLVENTDAAVGAVAVATILIANEIAIEEQDQRLDVQGIVFQPVRTGSFRFGTASATQTIRPLLKLKSTESVPLWRVRFVERDGRVVDFVGGGWVPILVDNGEAGFSYFISGEADSVRFSLYKTTGEATYHGALVDGIVDLDALAAAVAARLLPTGGADGQVLGHASGSPAWQAAAAGGDGPSLAQVHTVSFQSATAFGSSNKTRGSGWTIPAGRLIQLRVRHRSQPALWWKSPIIQTDLLRSFDPKSAGSADLGDDDAYETPPVRKAGGGNPIRFGRTSANELLVNLTGSYASAAFRVDVMELT